MVILLTRVVKCLYNKICLGIVQQLGQNKPAEKLLALAIIVHCNPSIGWTSKIRRLVHLKHELLD